MAKTLRQKIFGRKVTGAEFGIIGVSFLAASMSIFQNLFRDSNLSSGIEQNITNTPPNLFVIFRNSTIYSFFIEYLFVRIFKL